MQQFSAKPADISSVLRIMRDRQAQGNDAILAERKLLCPCCENRFAISLMPLIKHTGIVGPVVDCLCRCCHKEHGPEFARLVRVVCAGCREVVAVVSPGKERSGFVWREGGYVHVAECPACTRNPELRESPIAEKLAFYKRNGIPYA